jgi:3-phenylpropionate/trans-cinnamate dioxygenase ferredoxin subunit
MDMHKQLVRVCSTAEIPEGRAKTFLIDGRDIAIARYRNKFYAFENTCTHDGGILGEGEIINGEIECPRHGARFNITNGRAMRMPAIEDIETFEVHIENDYIHVEVPD